jgi:ATP-dependent RNA/DNA helicase IGHMBP2
MTDARLPDDHFLRLKHLLDLEAEAEKQESLLLMQRHSPQGAEATGNTLIGLVIRAQDAGMGGRVLVTLGKKNENLPLPWTRLGTGAPVILSEAGESGGWRGIVSSLDHKTIQVAFPDWPEPETDRPTFRLDRAPDEVARKRQRQALDRARTAKDSRLAVLRNVLLGVEPPQFHPVPIPAPLDLTLNASQHAAVHFALTAQDVAIIHGPPGTGKTTTLVELIRQITRRGERVLAVAPSNLAVDNLLEKVLAAGEKAIRLGHPARVLPELRQHTLDILVETHPDIRLANKLAREAYALRGQAAKYTRAKPQPGARYAMRQEARELLADARKIEDQVIERILDGAMVICATSTGLDRNILGERTFEWCIMDEASQSTEPGAWIPLQFARRLVLAGDHFQLPPTVVSTEAAAAGFNVSLLERLVKELGPQIARRLDVQYRMHTDIMTFSSREFYESSLLAHESVASHQLRDLQGVEANDLTVAPVDFIDTAGASYDEQVEPEGESRLNPLEAELVLRKVQALLDAGISATDIAVISPYAAQVRLLREWVKQGEVEIDSVDGFQGREKEAVIVTLVRSNRENEIGFLADVRRMNVALTRARRKLIVIGDSATITAHPFYQRLVDYFESIGAYHSVWEEAV